MTITYHKEVIQRSETWYKLRCGVLTASEMKLIINIPAVETRIKKDGTPYKQREITYADNDNSRRHVYDIAAQRITRFVNPTFQTFDMARGVEDELEARILYNANYAPVEDCGFITNDEWGFTIGYSPDGLIGAPGLIEAKSRKPSLQMEVIVNNIALDTMPDDHILQVQTGLLVTKREWCDYITYCGGLDMATVRIYPDPLIQEAIVMAARNFEQRVQETIAVYNSVKNNAAMRILPTERRVEEEMAA